MLTQCCAPCNQHTLARTHRHTRTHTHTHSVAAFVRQTRKENVAYKWAQSEQNLKLKINCKHKQQTNSERQWEGGEGREKESAGIWKWEGFVDLWKYAVQHRKKLRESRQQQQKQKQKQQLVCSCTYSCILIFWHFKSIWQCLSCCRAGQVASAGKWQRQRQRLLWILKIKLYPHINCTLSTWVP